MVMFFSIFIFTTVQEACCFTMKILAEIKRGLGMTKEELRDYVDEQRALDEIPYHVYSALIDGIDELEQEPCNYCPKCGKRLYEPQESEGKG